MKKLQLLLIGLILAAVVDAQLPQVRFDTTLADLHVRKVYQFTGLGVQESIGDVTIDSTFLNTAGRITNQFIVYTFSTVTGELLGDPQTGRVVTTDSVRLKYWADRLCEQETFESIINDYRDEINK